ncbi:unnamed protein product [Strongylus vulgaris]|uniref:PABS domain-containing protein n=1 Tax=Strongylus vulgaris TaxID=40348 RepID=A0A3P7KAA4_STRVU|nr:unnamed protein product [Strongylus vulgaris]
MKKIARKWYQYRESPKHRIVIKDGLEFVQSAADKGEKYDAVLVDLCVNKKRDLMCPTEHFVGDVAMSNLAAITANTGLPLYL